MFNYNVQNTQPQQIIPQPVPQQQIIYQQPQQVIYQQPLRPASLSPAPVNPSILKPKPQQPIQVVQPVQPIPQPVPQQQSEWK